MLTWLKSRVSRRVADRMLPATMPRPGLRDRLNRWAYEHASQAGQNRMVMQQMAYLQWRRQMAILAKSADATRESVPYPSYNTFGYSRQRGLRVLPKPTPINLRVLSQSPPAMRCIEKIKSMVTPLPWKCQPRDHKPGEEIPAEMQKRIDGVERAMRRPNNDGDTWKTFLGQFIEEICVGGCGAAELRIGNFSGDRPFFLWPVDGLSIQINWNWLGDDSDSPDNAVKYVQTFPYGNSNQYTSAAPIGKQFFDKELIYARFRPRANTPFGFGPLESAFQGINAWLGAMDARERMESNEIPPFGIALGEGASDEDAAVARDFWIDAVEGNGEVPFWAGGKNPEVLQFRQADRGNKNQWPELLLRAICLPFGLPPQTMGIEKDVNRTNSEVMASDEFTSAALPMIQLVEDALTSHLLEKGLEYDDLEIKATISQGDPLKQAQTVDILVGANVITIDEGRGKIGLEDMPDGKGAVTAAEHVAQQQPAEMPGMGNEDPTHPAAKIAKEAGKPGETPAKPGAKPNGKPAKLPANAVKASVAEVRAAVLAAIEAGRDDDALVSIPVQDDVATVLRGVLAEADDAA